MKIWNAQLVTGPPTAQKQAKTLKAICKEIGVSYSTAKKKQDKAGGVTIWVVKDKVWHVWRSLIIQKS